MLTTYKAVNIISLRRLEGKFFDAVHLSFSTCQIYTRREPNAELHSRFYSTNVWVSGWGWYVSISARMCVRTCECAYVLYDDITATGLFGMHFNWCLDKAMKADVRVLLGDAYYPTVLRTLSAQKATLPAHGVRPSNHNSSPSPAQRW